MNKLTKDTKKSMTQRIVTGLLLIGICAPAIFFGGWFFISIVVIALAFIIHEFTNAPSHEKYGFFIHAFIFIMTFSFVLWILIKNNLGNYADFSESFNPHFELWSLPSGFYDVVTKKLSIEISTIGVAVTVFVLFFISILHKNFEIPDVTYLTTMTIFVGVGVQSFVFLRMIPEALIPNVDFWQSSFLLIYVLLGCFLSDVGAYFTGVIFGKHKMNERISPKKTWEGFFGGIAISVVGSILFAFIADACGRPILPFLDLEHWYWVVLLSIAMPFIANLGDFIFSALKRHFQIKDYGTLLKGHGGVLDRVDSLLCTALFVGIIIIFINNGWNFLV